MKQNIILDMSFAFAVRIVKLSRYLCAEKKEYVLSRQVLRSGTSIGANVKEAIVAQSRKDFIAKLNISLKEANETEYWLQLLHATDLLDDVDSILEDNRSIIRVLTSIIKSTNNNTPTK
ncbi:MAG: four helix bundle protein [Candidatus Cloacimonetes bacterium]|nr:four helix bundle protein [Candidatus Cloacimonadota bacterium]